MMLKGSDNKHRHPERSAAGKSLKQGKRIIRRAVEGRHPYFYGVHKYGPHDLVSSATLHFVPCNQTICVRMCEINTESYFFLPLSTKRGGRGVSWSKPTMAGAEAVSLRGQSNQTDFTCCPKQEPPRFKCSVYRESWSVASRSMIRFETDNETKYLHYLLQPSKNEGENEGESGVNNCANLHQTTVHIGLRSSRLAENLGEKYGEKLGDRLCEKLGDRLGDRLSETPEQILFEPTSTSQNALCRRLTKLGDRLGEKVVDRLCENLCDNMCKNLCENSNPPHPPRIPITVSQILSQPVRELPPTYKSAITTHDNRQPRHILRQAVAETAAVTPNPTQTLQNRTHNNSISVNLY